MNETPRGFPYIVHVKDGDLGFSELDSELRDVLFTRMQEGVGIDMQMQAIAYAKQPYRKEIMIPEDYLEDVYLPYDAPKPPPRNSFLSWFKRG